MRRRLLLGLGVAGMVAGSAIAQVPGDRGTAPPALPTGIQPLVPGQTAPGTAPRASLATAPPNIEIKTAVPANHPWLIKPDHGEYFICVKSYSRPSQPTPDDKGPMALALAEGLAGEIRDQYRVQAFLFEHISDERKAEAAAIAAAREKGRIFAEQMDKYRQQAQLQGMEFLEDRSVKIHYKSINYRDQIAVLVGGFKSEEDARKALDQVRKWPAPKTRVEGMALMDWGTMTRTGPDGKPALERDYINPYLTATVVPNPTIPRANQTGTNELDPLIQRLNEGRPYNLLNANKGWTLAVKSFIAPVEIVGRDGGTSVMRKMGASKGADALRAGAEQAESLAKVVREMKDKGGNSLGLEAFVLHTREASIVTVGQFEGPNDPELLAKKRLLESMHMSVTEDRMGVRPAMNSQSLFERITPIPIPKKNP